MEWKKNETEIDGGTEYELCPLCLCVTEVLVDDNGLVWAERCINCNWRLDFNED